MGSATAGADFLSGLFLGGLGSSAATSPAIMALISDGSEAMHGVMGMSCAVLAEGSVMILSVSGAVL